MKVSNPFAQLIQNACGCKGITFATIPDHRLGESPETLVASASSGLAVTFGSATPSVCAAIGANSVAIFSAGTCTITADQAGNAYYGSALQVTRSFTVNLVGVGQRKLYYVHPDQLGTPRAITASADNSVVWTWSNDEPFGANLQNENPSNTGAAFQYNNRFPGQYYDAETGTHYNYFRDFDPQVGRYAQSDPIVLITRMSPAAWRHILLNGHYTFQSGGKIDLNALLAGLDLG